MRRSFVGSWRMVSTISKRSASLSLSTSPQGVVVVLMRAERSSMKRSCFVLALRWCSMSVILLIRVLLGRW